MKSDRPANLQLATTIDPLFQTFAQQVAWWHAGEKRQLEREVYDAIEAAIQIYEELPTDDVRRLAQYALDEIEVSRKIQRIQKTRIERGTRTESEWREAGNWGGGGSGHWGSFEEVSTEVPYEEEIEYVEESKTGSIHTTKMKYFLFDDAAVRLVLDAEEGN